MPRSVIGRVVALMLVVVVAHCDPTPLNKCYGIEPHSGKAACCKRGMDAWLEVPTNRRTHNYMQQLPYVSLHAYAGQSYISPITRGTKRVHPGPTGIITESTVQTGGCERCLRKIRHAACLRGLCSSVHQLPFCIRATNHRRSIIQEGV